MAMEIASTDVFLPLRQLLQAELDVAGLAGGMVEPSPSPGGFTRWYLQAIQKLEAHVAEGDEHAPMARGEVELQCRCALSGANLEEAIQLLSRFAEMLHPRAGRIGLEHRQALLHFQLDSLRRRLTTASSLVDITGLFAFRQLLQWLVGRELPVREVRIGPIRRDDVLPFLKLFRAPVLSGGSDYALVFDREALDWPVVRQAAEFADFFDLFPCAVFLPQDHSLAAQVSALLAAMLAQGERSPTQQRLAGELGLSLSTFRQRLRREGSGFRQLREQALAEAAVHGLSRGQSVGNLALQLGFADAGSFRRAFRQWYGCTPSEWRSKIRENSD